MIKKDADKVINKLPDSPSLYEWKKNWILLNYTSP